MFFFVIACRYDPRWYNDFLMLPRDRPVVFSHRFLLAGGICFRNLLGSDEGLALSELIVQRVRVCVCLHILFTERKPFSSDSQPQNFKISLTLVLSLGNDFHAVNQVTRFVSFHL